MVWVFRNPEDALSWDSRRLLDTAESEEHWQSVGRDKPLSNGVPQMMIEFVAGDSIDVHEVTLVRLHQVLLPV